MKCSVIWLIRIIVSLGVVVATSCSILMFDQSPILIESQESMTNKKEPIFNKIQYIPGINKDIWLMKQSHRGLKAPENQWDRLSIVVKNRKDEAIFRQHSNTTQLGIESPTKDFSVSCYLCHSNGPRAIRPKWDSKWAPVSYWNQARIQLWNLRIKLYGTMKGIGEGSRSPFAMNHWNLKQELKIKACTKCHHDGFLGRGVLKKHHFLSIKFMVENRYMPPKGFSLKESDRKKIEDFVTQF